MTTAPTVTRTKAAVRRDPNAPIGQPATLHLICECSAQVTIPPSADVVTCAECGQSFTSTGWLLPRTL